MKPAKATKPAQPNPNPEAIPVAVYVRLSKEDLSGKRLGIESTAIQLKDAKEAIEREGWTLDPRHIFTDDGISGTKINRDAWQAMLAAARRREFATIVVRDLDRFSRLDPVKTLGVIRDLNDLGVTLWSYRDRSTISVDGDQVVFTAMRARQAAAEAEKASERITAGLRARSREGRATGRAPFGYRIKTVTDADFRDSGGKDRPGKWWVKHPPEITVIHHIADVFLKHESLAATCRELNADGTRSPYGRCWYAHTVRAILEQPLARGYRLQNKERVELPDLQIFTSAQIRSLDAALAKASTNHPWSAAPRKSGRFNLAIPFLSCGICGGAMATCGSDRGGYSYQCDRHRLGGCRGVGYRSKARVDEALIRAIDATLTPEAISAVCGLVKKELDSQPAKMSNEKDRLSREVTAVEKRISNLAEAVAEAPHAARAPLYAKLGAEQDRLAALKAGLARVEGAPADLAPRRLIAMVEKRARELRALLAKGGPDAQGAIRAVLGSTRLKAHLVSIEGKRGWKLTGNVGGFYVLDEHYGSNDKLMARVQTMVVGAVA